MTFPARLLSAAELERLAAARAQLSDAPDLTAAQVEELAAAWRSTVQPAGKEEEPFDLVDGEGRPTGVQAPRWLCHLLGLRHRTVHLVLRTPQGWLVLQQRSRRVRSWPGYLDLAVTGHVRAGLSWEEALHREAAEELGLDLAVETGMVEAPGALLVAQYSRRETDCENPPEHIYHVTRVYAAVLTAVGLASLRFADGEVDGLYLCSADEAIRMLAEEPERFAPGVSRSLPRYLDWERHPGGR